MMELKLGMLFEKNKTEMFYFDRKGQPAERLRKCPIYDELLIVSFRDCPHFQM